MIAAVRPQNKFFAFIGKRAKEGLGWLIPMLIAAFAAALLSYVYNQKANTLLVIQQQKLADLQQFRSSGAQLDQALSQMSDALVDEKGLEPARRDMRNAIARNLSDAAAVRHLLGEEPTDAYITHLAELREIVDQTDTIESGQGLWQGAINLMAERRKLVQNGERMILTRDKSPRS